MTLGDRIVVMKDGLIQQADTPLQTYNFPVNRFVAGFIGMPPMNFFEGKIQNTGSELVFEEGKLEGAHAVSGTTGNGNGTPRSDEPVVLDGNLTIPGNGFKLPVPAHLRERMAGYAGKRVVLGVRPEHLHLRQTEESMPLKVKITVIEPLGSDMDVYMCTSLHDHVVGRVEAQSGLATDKEATVYVDLQKVHFFEPGATGMNLSLGGTTSHSEPAHALA
jgi:multiple sugar transport system ATP-binding protein